MSIISFSFCLSGCSSSTIRIGLYIFLSLSCCNVSFSEIINIDCKINFGDGTKFDKSWKLDSKTGNYWNKFSDNTITWVEVVIPENNDDDKYSSTIRYWQDGKFGTSFQFYLDAIEIIETSHFSEGFKDVEKSKVLEARKTAFGSDFEYYPPWKLR